MANKEDLCGYKRVVLGDEQLSDLVENKNPEQTYGCKKNEYLIVNDKDGNLVDLYKRTDCGFERIKYKTANSEINKQVKPKNTEQRLAMDMLFDEQSTIKVITGKFGTGKDFLMCAAAASLIESGYYDRIVYVRNNVEVKDSKPIGHLPGSFNEKMLPFVMPLADHLGGVDGLSEWLEKGIVEVVHLGFIRGRDIKRSIIICSEAENMTVEHIQLLIGRVGEGSALWINGDFKQTDAEIFREKSGLMAAVSKLRGHKRFAHVKLIKTERSETAAMADLLD